MEPQRLHDDEGDEGGEHDEVAMRDIDQPHDAEGEREPDGEERIEPAEQGALDEDRRASAIRRCSDAEIGGGDGGAVEAVGGAGRARRGPPGSSRSGRRRPSAWLMSCSTITSVVPSAAISASRA